MRLNDQRAPVEQPSEGGLLQLLLNAQAMPGPIDSSELPTLLPLERQGKDIIVTLS